MPDVIMGRNADGSPPDIEQVVIGQLIGFTQILDRAIEMLGIADDGEKYAVLSEAQARELRGLLGAIAAAMTRAREPK
jgi:hypothetical protein